MWDVIASIGKSSLYWLALIFLGLSFEAVALYYQYAMDEMPCVLCIHARLWVMALILVSLLALWLRWMRFTNLLAHLLTLFAATMLLERSYQLLGTERGFVFGECSFDLGLPAWFAPDKWFPAMFQVETSCGYTPQLLFGVTFAEALIVLSSVLVLISAAMTVTAIVRYRMQ